MSKRDAVFRAKAPVAMRRLMREFDIDKTHAAAVLGNAGHESNGLRTMQEERPTVPGSRGGFGWFQWTGPRRKAFEAWCKARGLRPTSDAANIGFLVHELQTTEAKAISVLRKASGLEDAVQAFEMAYERAGIKHYSGRIGWAKIALEAFDASPAANAKPLAKSRTAAGGIVATVAGGGVVVNAATDISDAATTAADHASAGNWIGVVLGFVILIAALVVVYARWDDAGKPLPAWLGGES